MTERGGGVGQIETSYTATLPGGETLLLRATPASLSPCQSPAQAAAACLHMKRDLQRLQAADLVLAAVQPLHHLCVGLRPHLSDRQNVVCLLTGSADCGAQPNLALGYHMSYVQLYCFGVTAVCCSAAACMLHCALEQISQR